MAKKIYVSAYGQSYQESSLEYEKEINASRWVIEIIKIKFPSITTDDAYLLIRNSLSAVNTYKICDSSK